MHYSDAVPTNILFLIAVTLENGERADFHLVLPVKLRYRRNDELRVSFFIMDCLLEKATQLEWNSVKITVNIRNLQYHTMSQTFHFPL